MSFITLVIANPLLAQDTDSGLSFSTSIKDQLIPTPQIMKTATNTQNAARMNSNIDRRNQPNSFDQASFTVEPPRRFEDLRAGETPLFAKSIERHALSRSEASDR